MYEIIDFFLSPNKKHLLKVIVTVFSSGCLQFWGPDHQLYLQLFDLTHLTLEIPIKKIAAKVLNKGAKTKT